MALIDFHQSQEARHHWSNPVAVLALRAPYYQGIGGGGGGTYCLSQAIFLSPHSLETLAKTLSSLALYCPFLVAQDRIARAKPAIGTT